jgi:hypothetical protein
MEHGT